MWATAMASYIEDGAYYCRGSFQRLADALADRLTAAGGELLLSTSVTRIVATDRRVRGVVLSTDQHVGAPVVLSAIDPRDTFGALLNRDQVPDRYARRLQHLDPSMSVLAQYLATDLDLRALGARHEMEVFAAWDLDQVFADGQQGRVRWVTVLVPPLTDPSLAPAGEHIVIIKAIAPRRADGSSSTDDSGLAEPMLELAERALPGLRRHVTYAVGTTDEQRSIPVHRLGPIYGWAASPAQAGVRRLPHRTPIRGLHLVGHWTQPGHAIFGVVQSGVQAARLVLGAAAPPTGTHRIPAHIAPGPGNRSGAARFE
jgi:prolycopene isomerase